MSFFAERCPSCGYWIEQRSQAQNDAFHAICQDLADQRDWPRDSGTMISVTAWKRLLIAAWERSQERRAELYPSIDRDGLDVVYTRSSRMSKKEMSLLIDYARAWAINEDVVMSGMPPLEERAA